MASSSSALGPTGFFSLKAPTFRRWCGNFGWPILLKELRADFRKSRFFVTHFVCVLAISVAVMIQVWSQSDTGLGKLSSVQLGRSLFDCFFALQCLVVLIVFPALTSTAFTEERTSKSLPLLMTSDLRPGEIVFGKFFATSAYCLMTIIGTVPILAVTTLLGGVQIGEIAIAYTFLIGHTIVIAMTGVFLSSCFTSNLRATLTVYTLVFVYGVFAYNVLGWNTDLLAQSESNVETFVGLLVLNGVTEPTGGESLEFLVGLGLAVAGLFAFLFVLTTNRLRASTDDRSSRLRLLTLLVLGLHLLACWMRPVPEFSAGAAYEGILAAESLLFQHVVTTLLALFAVTLVFATEPLRLSRRVRRDFGALRGLRAPLRLLTPGSFWGFIFVGLLLAASTGVLFANWADVVATVPVDALSTEDAAQWGLVATRWRELILTMPLFLLAFAALGFFLSASGFTRGYGFLTAFFVAVIVVLLPVIFRFQSWPDSILSLYYLSPFTLWESLADATHVDENAPKFIVLGGIPVIHFAKLVFGGAAAILVTWGVVMARKRDMPLVRL